MKPLLPTASAAAAIPASSTHAVVAIALGPVGATVAPASGTNTDDKTQMLSDGSYAADPIERHGTPVTEMRKIVGLTPIPKNSLLDDLENFDLGGQFHPAIVAQPKSQNATAAAPASPRAVTVDVKIGDHKQANRAHRHISPRLPAELKTKMEALFLDLSMKRDQAAGTEKDKIKLQIDFLKALNANITARLGPYSAPADPNERYQNSIYEGYLYTKNLKDFETVDTTSMSMLIEELEHYYSNTSNKRMKIGCNECCHRMCTIA